MNTIKIDNKNVKMVAHRGLSGLEKENTCAAFVAACNRESYYGVETDVHRTADGEFVVIHDDHTGRVALDDLVVENSTYETLRSLRLADTDGRRGRTDLRIPSLAEYIAICQKYGKHCVLELKNEFAKEDVWRIAGIIGQMGWLDEVTFISFQLNNLLALRERYPNQPAQYLVKEWNPEIFAILKANRLDVDIDYRAATPEAVQQLHEAGLEINCWTVDSAQDALALVEMGVDYITTDIIEGICPAK